MKTLMILLMLTGCGYTYKGNVVTGQVKKVANKTPLICDDFNEADISLGVIRNGVGSMSTEDIDVYIPNKELLDKLKSAEHSGNLVKIIYDVKRLTLCKPERQATDVEILK